MKNRNQTLRGAVIGFGFISSKGHLPAYLERFRSHGDFEIIAITDVCDERRRLAQSLFPQLTVYPDYQSLIAQERQKLDFLDICTPPSFHAEIAHAGLEAGLHILCEKPLTTRAEDAKALITHATKAKKVLYPCHNYKHAPVVRAIQETIRSGRIGNVRSLTLSTFRNTHAKGVPQWNTHWRIQKNYSGGGITMDHGSHTLYLTFDWMGEYPQAVTAKMNHSKGDGLQNYDHLLDSQATEDTVSLVLTFPNGTAHTHLTWRAGVRKIIYTIQGEKGAITVDDDEMQIALMDAAPEKEDVAQGAVHWRVEKKSVASHWMDASHVKWFETLLGEFKTAIDQNNYVSKDTWESYFCIELIEKSYDSARDGSREKKLNLRIPSP